MGLLSKLYIKDEQNRNVACKTLQRKEIDSH